MLNFSQLLESFKAVFWPAKCIFCGNVIFNNPYQTCDKCKDQLPFVEGVVCFNCGCEKRNCSCSSSIMYFDKVAAPFYYQDLVKKSIRKMKFSNREEYAKAFSHYMLKTLEEKYHDEKFDFIACVPLHKKDRRKRGYNQSERLALYLSEETKIPFKSNLIQKNYYTKTQSSQSMIKRSGNVLGAFELRADSDVNGCSVLLIDDIKTTGSTLSECGKMLLLAGAENVCCLSAAVTKIEKQRKR